MQSVRSERVYDGDNIIAEYTSTSLGAGDGQGNLTKKFIYGPGIDEPIKGLSLQGTVPEWYYHSDGLGSVTEITDSSGAVIEKYAYDVYGKVIIKDANDNVLTQSSIGNTYFFTGRELDSETNLYYYRARYYDPNTGRFLQADPIGYQGGINLYAYRRNNPINFTDPMGLCGKDLTEEEKGEFARLSRWLKFNQGVADGLAGKYGGEGIKEGLANLSGMGYEVKVQIGTKGIHTFIDIGGVSYGYGPRGIRLSDDYGNGEWATYGNTDAEPIATENRINEMKKSGEWKGSNYNLTVHNCYHFVNAALDLK